MNEGAVQLRLSGEARIASFVERLLRRWRIGERGRRGAARVSFRWVRPWYDVDDESPSVSRVADRVVRRGVIARTLLDATSFGRRTTAASESMEALRGKSMAEALAVRATAMARGSHPTPEIAPALLRSPRALHHAEWAESVDQRIRLEPGRHPWAAARRRDGSHAASEIAGSPRRSPRALRHADWAERAEWAERTNRRIRLEPGRYPWVAAPRREHAANPMEPGSTEGARPIVGAPAERVRPLVLPEPRPTLPDLRPTLLDLRSTSFGRSEGEPFFASALALGRFSDERKGRRGSAEAEADARARGGTLRRGVGNKPLALATHAAEVWRSRGAEVPTPFFDRLIGGTPTGSSDWSVLDRISAARARPSRRPELALSLLRPSFEPSGATRGRSPSRGAHPLRDSRPAETRAKRVWPAPPLGSIAGFAEHAAAEPAARAQRWAAELIEPALGFGLTTDRASPARPLLTSPPHPTLGALGTTPPSTRGREWPHGRKSGCASPLVPSSWSRRALLADRYQADLTGMMLPPDAAGARRFPGQPQPVLCVDATPRGKEATRKTTRATQKPISSASDSRISLADLTLISTASAPERPRARRSGEAPASPKAKSPQEKALAPPSGNDRAAVPASEIESLARQVFAQLELEMEISHERSGLRWES